MADNFIRDLIKKLDDISPKFLSRGITEEISIGEGTHSKSCSLGVKSATTKGLSCISTSLQPTNIFGDGHTSIEGELATKSANPIGIC